MADEKKGITVKIDADLHAEIREYLERHEGMTMAEFITLAVDDELHPKIQQKEGNNMGNMRTMAFQVPEELFQRIKDYLHRNNMSQKEFVLGLILVTAPSPNVLCRTMEPSLTSGATNSSCLAAIFAAAEAAGLTPYCAVTEGFSTA